MKTPSLIRVILFLSIILPACTANPQTPVLAETIQPASNAEYLTIKVDEVEILGAPGDLLGQGEFRFYVIVSDGNQNNSAGLFCPAGEPIPIRVGSKTPCYGGISFPVADLDQELFVLLIGKDEDSLSGLPDYGSQLATTTLVDGFTGLLKNNSSMLENFFETSVIIAGVQFFPINIIFGTTIGFGADFLQEEDVIGGQGMHLTKDNHWGDGEMHDFVTGDGNLRIKMQISITRSPEATPNVEIPPKYLTPFVTERVIVITATSPPQISPTPSTLKPTPTEAKPAPTKVIPTTSSSPLSLEDFIRAYYEAINNRDYDYTWAMLSDEFKANAHGPSQGGYQGYVDFWNTVSEVEILDVNVNQQNDSSATVFIRANYHYKAGYTTTSESNFYFVFDTKQNTWLFGW